MMIMMMMMTALNRRSSGCSSIVVVLLGQTNVSPEATEDKAARQERLVFPEQQRSEALQHSS